MKVKAEVVIGIVVLAVVGLVIGIFLSINTPIKPIKEEAAKEEGALPVNTQTSDFTLIVSSSGQSICEGCHLSGKKSVPQAYGVKQHIEGGAYCMECHKIDHSTHPMNDNVTCERCHGSAKTPQIPAFRDGTISCAECHDHPDPLKPSNGNLVVIHRPRNVDCIRCHADSCLKCHDEIKTDKKWEKRLGHFTALLKNNQ